jgi:hypothetical protein
VPHSLVSFYVVAVLIVLLWLGEKITELLRTLKRIEARLTLLSPLDEEKTLMDEGLVTLRGGLRNRAMHPDIWVSQAIKDERGLQGKERKEARSLRRYREKRYRD